MELSQRIESAIRQEKGVRLSPAETRRMATLLNLQGPPLRLPSKAKRKLVDDVHIRWMIRRDMPLVLEIESQAYDLPWNEKDFINCLRQRNCIGMVAEADEQIVGFMLYELHKRHLNILNFAVASDYRKQGVGSTMMGKLKGKLSAERRCRIISEVRESNLDAQLFCKAIGFRATDVREQFYDDTKEAAFLFEYTYQEVSS